MGQIVLQFSTACAREVASKWLPRWVEVQVNRWYAFIDASTWIRRLCHSPFSHVDFVLEDGSLLGASYNPTAPVVTGNPCGVAIRPADYQSFGIRRRAYITTDCADAILDYAKQQLGKPFDSAAVSPRYFLSDKFGSRDWVAEDKWFCAELACRACEVGGLFPWELIAIKNRITPSDLLLILNPLMDVDRFWMKVPTLVLSAREV